MSQVSSPLSAQQFADLHSDEPSAIATMAQGLGHANWQIRRAAVAAVTRWHRQSQLTAAAGQSLARVLVDGLGAEDNAGMRNACAQGIGALGDVVLPLLQQTLGHADADQRKFIIEALGTSGAPRIRGLLVGLMRDEIDKLSDGASDSNIRTALMEALGHYPSSDMRELLFALAQAPNATLQDRASALHTLSKWHTQLPLKPLLALLTIIGLHRAVYPLLGLSQDVGAIPSLMHASIRGSGASRREAIVALAGLWGALGQNAEASMRQCASSYPEAADIWLQHLDQEPAVVDGAVRLLGLCDCSAAAADILQACADKGQAHAAIDCMARQGKKALPHILAALAVRDTQTQLLCIDAIEAIGDASAAFALVDMLPQAGSHLLGAIVRALGVLGGADDIAVLMDLVRQHESAEIARQVVWALSRMGQRQPGPVAEQMRQALARGDVQPSWLRVLGALGQADDVPRLIAGLGHQDAEVRMGVLEAATQMGAQLPEQAVLAALGDAHPEVRLAAAKLLSSYGSEAVFDGLMTAMHDQDPWVVAEAARALGHLQKRDGIHALRQAASHSNGPIAMAALESLARLAPDDLSQTVQQALKHVDAEVVREALQLASQLDRSFAQQTLCEALGHPAWDVRAAAAELLLRKRWLPTVEVIQRALERESEPLVRDRLDQLQSRLGALS